jgi:hypothetical protein
MNIGFDKPLYIQPFDHRGPFQSKLFGWKGKLTRKQTAEIAAAKQVIYDDFRAAVDAGVPKEKAGILVDEQFGSSHPPRCGGTGFLYRLSSREECTGVHWFRRLSYRVLGTAGCAARQENFTSSSRLGSCPPLSGTGRDF